ncbi:hypothetical protein D9M70_569080 [compost metagenome]
MQQHGDGNRSNRHFTIRLELADGFQDDPARPRPAPGVGHAILDMEAARQVGGNIVQLLQAAIWVIRTD